jgi:hypothetical protein
MKSTTIFCLLLGCWMYHIGLNEVVYQILLWLLLSLKRRPHFKTCKSLERT